MAAARSAGLALAVLILVVGRAAMAGPMPLTIFADDTLKPALDPIAAAWAAKSGVAPILVYGATGRLAKRIEAGVPADVFVATGVKAMEALEKAHLINGRTRQPIIGNDLVLVASAESKIALKLGLEADLVGALAGGKLAICSAEFCPAGVLARQSLDTLKIGPGVQSLIVQTDDNQAALNLVLGGKAALAIVYATEAKAEPKVRIVDTFPAATHDPIVFPIALTNATKNPDAARFEAFTRSGEAVRILLGQGFAVLK